jgi:hypothetical protein
VGYRWCDDRGRIGGVCDAAEGSGRLFVAVAGERIGVNCGRGLIFSSDLPRSCCSSSTTETAFPVPYAYGAEESCAAQLSAR